MKVYFLSGLGADKRAYERISLPAGFEIHHIEWKPLKGDESIENYAKCLSEEIDSSEPFILVGLSFGGMVAIEISKIVKPFKLILFSTVRKRTELPLLYRLAGKLRIYSVLPYKLFSLGLPLLYWFFGPLDKEGKVLISKFLRQTDSGMLTWAFKQISRWKNMEVPAENIHIHGGRDRVFPVRLCKPEHTIQDAGHLCVFTHAAKVNAILKGYLSFN
jgi:pimeloyl-ACP methyl ester carboxylesterase